MYKFEVHQTINQLVRLYYFLGIWKNVDESKFRKTIRETIYLTCFVLQVIYYVTCALLSDNTNTCIFLLEVAIGVSVVTIKVMYVFWKKDEILDFVYVRIVAHSTECRERWEEVNRKVNLFMKCVRLFVYELYSALVFINISCLPIFFNEKTLPLYITYRLDSEILYWATYTFSAMGFLYASIFLLITVFIWYVMLNFCTEYQELGIRLSKLGSKNEQGKSQSFARQLIDLIKAHRNIHKSVEDFKTCFAPLFLAQIFTSGISLCIVIYSLAYSSTENMQEIAIFVATLVYTLLDIFLLMYLANEITLASDELSFCLYDSNWTDQSESCKKYIIVFCEYIKQPQKLQVFLYPLNLETFTSILNFVYKTFNFLKSFQ